LTSTEFDQVVERALARIPRRFRRRLQNVALVVEPEPPRPGLLGLYRGRPMTRRSVFESFAMPDQITIYQGPHERIAASSLSRWWPTLSGTKSLTISAWTKGRSAGRSGAAGHSIRRGTPPGNLRFHAAASRLESRLQTESLLHNAVEPQPKGRYSIDDLAARPVAWRRGRAGTLMPRLGDWR
jgi:hypothetical protein